MNSYLLNLIETVNPKIGNLSNITSATHKFALAVLASQISEEFFDLEKLSNDKYSKDGLFYEIEYFDSEQMYISRNKAILLVVYCIENSTSYCPLRIEFSREDNGDFKIIVFNQREQGDIKRTLIECTDSIHYTSFENLSEIKLSNLVELEG